MMLQENIESSAVGPYRWLTLVMVKGSGLRECAFFNEKEKEKRAIYFRCGREKHLESFSHNKALL